MIVKYGKPTGQGALIMLIQSWEKRTLAHTCRPTIAVQFYLPKMHMQARRIMFIISSYCRPVFLSNQTMRWSERM